MENQEPFRFTYSAQQQEEIKAIRNKYAAPQEDKIEQLRRLDRQVSEKATAASLICGIIGALILGTGMSLFMSDLQNILGDYRHLSMLIGIPLGIIGIILICCAYPLYHRTLQKEREKIAPEVLRLTDELLK